jgi:flagellar biosynthetic protein FlhB
MPQEHRSQRTERPTPRRLKKARDRGQVPRSREIPGVAALGAFLLFGHMLGSGWLGRLQEMMASLLHQSGRIELSAANLQTVFQSTAMGTALLLAFPLGTVALASLAGNLLQGAPAFTLKPLEPKFDKLNPLKGLKKIFALRQWVEVLKSILKMALYTTVTYLAARSVILSHPPGTASVEGTLAMLITLTAKVLLHATGLAAGLALLDMLFRRYDHVRELKMSKREVKDELKQTEGDPMVRARVRQKQTALARSRMMADVSKATVVVTNPEHVAVALRYVRGETAAPKLLAKGRALLAERIRTIAREHRVPIVSDPPLARALYRSIPIGAEIPPAFFRAVAEVLALVLSRRGKRRKPLIATEEARR